MLTGITVPHNLAICNSNVGSDDDYVRLGLILLAKCRLRCNVPRPFLSILFGSAAFSVGRAVERLKKATGSTGLNGIDLRPPGKRFIML
jgi:hypothetical protein